MPLSCCWESRGVRACNMRVGLAYSCNVWEVPRRTAIESREYPVVQSGGSGNRDDGPLKDVRSGSRVDV